MLEIEIKLGDDLQERLEKAAKRAALAPEEMAKFILAQQLTSEKSFDWMELLQRGKALLTQVMSKES